MLEYIGRSI